MYMYVSRRRRLHSIGRRDPDSIAAPRRCHSRLRCLTGQLWPGGAEAPSTWSAARAGQRLLKLVSIAGRDSIVLQSIHLKDAVLGPVHALLRSLLCLPLLLSTVHNFCACWRLCSSRATLTTASLIAPSFIVRRQHRRPSTAALICEL